MKRYDMHYDQISDCYCEIEEKTEGDYVLYSDAEKLEKRVKELEEAFKHEYVEISFCGTRYCKVCELDGSDDIHFK